MTSTVVTSKAPLWHVSRQVLGYDICCLAGVGRAGPVIRLMQPGFSGPGRILGMTQMTAQLKMWKLSRTRTPGPIWPTRGPDPNRPTSSGGARSWSLGSCSPPGGLGDGSPEAGFRGRALVGVRGKAPRKRESGGRTPKSWAVFLMWGFSCSDLLYINGLTVLPRVWQTCWYVGSRTNSADKPD